MSGSPMVNQINGFITAGEIFTDQQIFWFAFLSTSALSFIAFLLGSSIASFLGVAAERPLRGESLNGRSHCACGRKLKWHENIPVFGWLKALGKTKCCASRIPKRYVVSEFILGLFYAAAGFSLTQDFLGTGAGNTNFLSWALVLLAGIATVVTFLVLRKLSKTTEVDVQAA